MKLIIYFKNKRNIILLLVYIFFFIIYYGYVINIKLLITNIKLKLEIYRNEHDLLLFNNQIKIIKRYKKNNNPKISIITPVYNSNKFILRFLKSIQNQIFFNIEIIFIDDSSIDNSIKIISDYKEVDNRIILIKNKKNKGTFINRNIGVLYSKGKYIVLPDPDDILSKNILNKCYKYAEKYNYEIIRFNMYIGNGNIVLSNINKKLKNKPLYQTELSTYIFYGINELQIIDWGLCNKFYKKEIYIKALNVLGNFYLNMHITFTEDTLLNYIIYRIAKSFFYIKNIGYYYIRNYLSITNNLFRKSELNIKFGLIFLQILFQFSKNNKYEKDMFNLFMTNSISHYDIEGRLLNRNSQLITSHLNKIIKIYLNSKFITKDNIIMFQKYKYIIEKISKFL